MSAPINPAYWIDAIRVAMHTTDCPTKQRVLSNAADHLEAHVADLEERLDRARDALFALIERQGAQP